MTYHRCKRFLDWKLDDPAGQTDVSHPKYCHDRSSILLREHSPATLHIGRSHCRVLDI